MIKQFNFNCIRLSHYPSDPYLLDLCDQFGITVLMVTHNVEQYKYGSRIIRMRDGKIELDEENMNCYLRLKREYPTMDRSDILSRGITDNDETA